MLPPGKARPGLGRSSTTAASRPTLDRSSTTAASLPARVPLRRAASAGPRAPAAAPKPLAPTVQYMTVRDARLLLAEARAGAAAKAEQLELVIGGHYTSLLHSADAVEAMYAGATNLDGRLASLGREVRPPAPPPAAAAAAAAAAPAPAPGPAFGISQALPELYAALDSGDCVRAAGLVARCRAEVGRAEAEGAPLCGLHALVETLAAELLALSWRVLRSSRWRTSAYAGALNAAVAVGGATATATAATATAAANAPQLLDRLLRGRCAWVNGALAAPASTTGLRAAVRAVQRTAVDAHLLFCSASPAVAPAPAAAALAWLQATCARVRAAAEAALAAVDTTAELAAAQRVLFAAARFDDRPRDAAAYAAACAALGVPAPQRDLWTRLFAQPLEAIVDRLLRASLADAGRTFLTELGTAAAALGATGLPLPARPAPPADGTTAPRLSAVETDAVAAALANAYAGQLRVLATDARALVADAGGGASLATALRDASAFALAALAARLRAALACLDAALDAAAAAEAPAAAAAAPAVRRRRRLARASAGDAAPGAGASASAAPSSASASALADAVLLVGKCCRALQRAGGSEGGAFSDLLLAGGAAASAAGARPFGVAAESLQAAFEIADCDGDGLLSPAEAAEALAAVAVGEEARDGAPAALLARGGDGGPPSVTFDELCLLATAALDGSAAASPLGRLGGALDATRAASRRIWAREACRRPTAVLAAALEAYRGGGSGAEWRDGRGGAWSSVDVDGGGGLWAPTAVSAPLATFVFDLTAALSAATSPDDLFLGDADAARAALASAASAAAAAAYAAAAAKQHPKLGETAALQLTLDARVLERHAPVGGGGGGAAAAAALADAVDPIHLHVLEAHLAQAAHRSVAGGRLHFGALFGAAAAGGAAGEGGAAAAAGEAAGALLRCAPVAKRRPLLPLPSNWDAAGAAADEPALGSGEGEAAADGGGASAQVGRLFGNLRKLVQ